MTMAAWQEPVSADLMDQALRELEAKLQGSIVRRQQARDSHANTWTWVAAEPPDAVVFPHSTQDVRHVVDVANRLRVPLIPFGGGTSLEGHVNAPFGGISLDMMHMNAIGPFAPQDFTIRVQSGATLAALNQFLEREPVFFSVDPGAGEATLGGLAATRASGSNTVRYGTMRENVVSLEVVLADGSVVETATAAPKSAAGYDLTHLMIGSEGTLGVITALTLRLHPRPSHIGVAVVPFSTVDKACRFVMDVRGAGLRPARIELLDALMVETVNFHSGMDLVPQPTLFIELHETSKALTESQNTLQTFADHGDCGAFQFGTDPKARATLWQARHDAFRALTTRWPGKTVLATDVCVPVSRLADAILAAQDEIAKRSLTAPIVGHVGDGNFHVLPVFDNADVNARADVSGLLDRLVEIAHDCKGTCTGEHGIGQGKRAYLAREAGRGLDVMKAIKAGLDPQNIFNPGKLF